MPRRVIHVSPAYFASDSIIGGGERYATSLAEAMAYHADTTLVSFGQARQSARHGRLRIEIYPTRRWQGGQAFDPLNYSFLRALAGADVVHCHQYRTGVTNLAILAAAVLGARVFVTDHGGVGRHFTGEWPLAGLLDGLLPVSAFSLRFLPPCELSRVIHGGVSSPFLTSRPRPAPERRLLFVGRLLPHKGINYLIESLDRETCLEVIGRVYDERYFKLLQDLAKGKNVQFVTDAPDEVLLEAYRRAAATVLPSVYTDVYGARYAMPELLGLVLLESMACGTPVICTNVGGMPEIVEDGVTGFVVPPNDPAALRATIDNLLDHPETARQMGQRGQQKVRRELTWDAVAQRCLKAYREG